MRVRDIRSSLARAAVWLVAVALLLPTTAEAGMLVRKDVKDLTGAERRDFVAAVFALKAAPSPFHPELSYYDQFVTWHLELSRCSPTDPLLRDMQLSHLGPMFLPWHRQFVRLFERALGQVAGRPVAVPYWDWTDPESTAAVFANDFMGGDGDPEQDWAVTSGPFRKGRWKLEVHPIGLQWSSSATPHLARRFGSLPESPLPTPEDVRFALRAPLYDAPPYGIESDPAVSFRNALEGFRPPLAALVGCGPDGVIGELPRPPYELHNAVHGWVGGLLLTDPPRQEAVGTMLNIMTSPNDPVFFLHHAMIDRVWATWQERNGVDTYLPTAGYPRNNVDDLMTPFDADGIRVTPADVADIRALGYRYARRGGRRAGHGARARKTRPRSALAPPGLSFRCGLTR